MRVTVVGAGVSGLVTATILQERGVDVTVIERGAQIGDRACSWFAGGMLAPWCERESAEPAVVERGQMALSWWPAHVPGVAANGTLVVAPPRDAGELLRFARRTDNFERLDGDAIAALEPDLAERFRQGLFFPAEAHLDPRAAVQVLAERLSAQGATLVFGQEAPALASGPTVDCRGFAARDKLPDLRGVRGEMVVVRTRDVRLSRPVRLLHPRVPLYIVPRSDDRFMIGATMIESEHRGAMTVRSAIELLSAAFTLHPAFAEAEIVEFGADVRPAFPDNLPKVIAIGQTAYLNGFYRHGFLLSPAMATEAADTVMDLARMAA